MSEIIVDIQSEAEGKTVFEWLVKNGYLISADCGGRGTCGKCRVRVLSGNFLSKDGKKAFTPDENGFVYSCKAVCTRAGAVVAVPVLTLAEESALFTEKTDCRELGIAVDIGTTTLAAAAVDIKDGKLLCTETRLNPQKSFGADVMSRISACEQGNLSELKKLVRCTIKEMVTTLLSKVGVSFAKSITVAGNTVMLHIFCGVSPVSMGVSPFKPVFSGEQILRGEDIGLPAERVVVLPASSAFIGSDITAGVMLCGLTELDEPSVLMDLGTNGEMVLCTGKKRGGRLFSASAAAGPALEGAGISCGTGGVNGAVNQVRILGGTVKYKTIGDLAPTGICGSGLVDAIALLIKTGVVDANGFMSEEKYMLPDGKLYISQADVHSFLLAKAAIRAALETLAAESGVALADVSQMYIAGGLGNCINRESAIVTGLLPDMPNCTIRSIGNSALEGAAEWLVSSYEYRNKLCEIAENCTDVEVSNSEFFKQNFIKYMVF